MTKLNIVDELQNEIVALAAKKNLGIRFTQSNTGKFTCYSCVYLFTGDSVGNVRSSNVVESWDFNQPKNAGTTSRCARYRTYLEVKNFLISY